MEGRKKARDVERKVALVGILKLQMQSSLPLALDALQPYNVTLHFVMYVQAYWQA